MVRLLVAHGANVNTDYHGLPTSPQHQACGTAVRLAMELELHEIVHFLLGSGADILLKPPIGGHDACSYEKFSAHLKAERELLTRQVEELQMEITALAMGIDSETSRI